MCSASLIHRTGKRRKHEVVKYKRRQEAAEQDDKARQDIEIEDEDEDETYNKLESKVDEIKTSADVTTAYGAILRERAKYIPLRLKYEERRLLRL